MGISFDHKAATWDDKPLRIKLVEKVWFEIKSKIKFGAIDKVLDYGCGTGLLGYKLIDRVNEVTFCDASASMLLQVEKKRDFYGYQNVKTLHSDFINDAIPDTGYDLILSMLVMHHVKTIDVLFSKFHTALAPSGLYCFIDLEEEDGSFHQDDHSVSHHGFGKEAIEGMLTEHGFEAISYSNHICIEREIDGVMREYPLFVLIVQKL
jgi:predicted TPR repeat methyltransferase